MQICECENAKSVAPTVRVVEESESCMVEICRIDGHIRYYFDGFLVKVAQTDFQTPVAAQSL